MRSRPYTVNPIKQICSSIAVFGGQRFVALDIAVEPLLIRQRRQRRLVNQRRIDSVYPNSIYERSILPLSN